MTTVLVNGNPETAAIWDPLCAELDRADVLRLSPPGFGAPIPDGFSCTVPARAWWPEASPGRSPHGWPLPKGPKWVRPSSPSTAPPSSRPWRT